MKPEPLTQAEITELGSVFYNGSAEFIQTIERAVNAKWEAMLSKQEPVAWIRPSGKAALEAGESATVYAFEGMSNTVPLYAAPVAQPAPEKQEMLKALKDVLETVKSWNNDDDLTWIQYRLPDIIARAEAAQQPAQQEPVAQCPNCLGTTRPHALDPQWEGKCECHDPLAQPAQQERTCSTCTYYNKEYDKCRHQGGCTSHEFWEPK